MHWSQAVIDLWQGAIFENAVKTLAYAITYVQVHEQHKTSGTDCPGFIQYNQ